MKILIRLTIFLFLATLSCPCELTGHTFCNHKNHIAIQSRQDIRILRTQPNTSGAAIIRNDSLNLHNTEEVF